ncbi:MAG TPA: hypothetical protein VGH23_00410 [Rhizomicrobium sp.]
MGEIESLGASLGYALWPSRTILSPSLSTDPEEVEDRPAGIRGGGEGR